jgi:phage shock protein E
MAAPRAFALALALALTLAASPSIAADPPARPPNPQIDYAAFAALVAGLAPVREAHRLPFAEFSRQARAKGALLLDARSESAFAQGHLKGSVNLPFSDFTDESLRRVIGANPDRPIYIYCNNNFADNRAPVVTKRIALALNIPTFINLHGYGYRNVWELADVIATDGPGVEWQSSDKAGNAG